METHPYRQSLEVEPLNFTEWETGELRQHIGRLIAESEFANQRKYPEIEHEINVGCFELVSRRADFNRLQSRLTQQDAQPGTAAC